MNIFKLIFYFIIFVFLFIIIFERMMIFFVGFILELPYLLLHSLLLSIFIIIVIIVREECFCIFAGKRINPFIGFDLCLLHILCLLSLLSLCDGLLLLLLSCEISSLRLIGLAFSFYDLGLRLLHLIKEF